MGGYASVEGAETSWWDKIESRSADLGGLLGGPLAAPALLAGGGASGSGLAAGGVFEGLFDGPARGQLLDHLDIGGENAVRQPREFVRDKPRPLESDGPTRKLSPEEVAAQKAAGRDIDRLQGTSNDNRNADKKFDPNQKLGDLSKMSPQERLAVLNQISQNDPKNQEAEAYCGPAAVIAAAMYSGGNDGLNALIEHIKADDLKQHPAQKAQWPFDGTPAGDAATQKQLADLQAKLADPKSGGLTQGDIKILQKTLYHDFQVQQDGRQLGRQGTQDQTLTNFINSDPNLAKLFFDKDGKQTMNIVNVDNEGTGQPHHWVLDINSAGGGAAQTAQDGRSYNTVYDPWKRAGGQVTTSGGNARLFQDYMSTAADPTVDIQRPKAP